MPLPSPVRFLDQGGQPMPEVSGRKPGDVFLASLARLKDVEKHRTPGVTGAAIDRAAHSSRSLPRGFWEYVPPSSFWSGPTNTGTPVAQENGTPQRTQGDSQDA